MELSGVHEVLVTLFELFEEIGVGAEVKGSLILLVPDIQTGSFRDKEDGNRGAALLLCTARHDGLETCWEGGGVCGRDERGGREGGREGPLTLPHAIKIRVNMIWCPMLSHFSALKHWEQCLGNEATIKLTFTSLVPDNQFPAFLIGHNQFQLFYYHDGVHNNISVLTYAQ